MLTKRTGANAKSLMFIVLFISALATTGHYFMRAEHDFSGSLHDIPPSLLPWPTTLKVGFSQLRTEAVKCIEAPLSVPEKIRPKMNDSFARLCREENEKQFTTLEEIPEPHRSRLISDLQNRLGREFYEKLKYDVGQLDPDIYSDESAKGNNKNRVYRFVFKWEHPQTDIEHYYATIEYRYGGELYLNLDLPEISKHPERSKVISLKDAIHIAESKGYGYSKNVVFEYDRKKDKLVYTFTDWLKSSAGGVMEYGKTLIIDAHNGKEIGQYDTSLIH